MIGTIQGTVRHKDLSFLVVDVAGVGYKIHTTTDTALAAAAGQSLFLWTHLAVKENALDLYGFTDKDELEAFELLITVSGIGPKTALSILNVASPQMLREAVASDDTTYLTKVGGISKKNAEKIVLELEGKLITGAGDRRRDMRAEGDVYEALLSLGYAEREIRDALKKLPKDLKSASEKVKRALKLIAERNG